MKWFGRKPGIWWRVTITLVFAAGSVFNFVEYGQQGDKMDLIGGIVFGLGAIFNLVDLIEQMRERKKMTQDEETA